MFISCKIISAGRKAVSPTIVAPRMAARTRRMSGRLKEVVAGGQVQVQVQVGRWVQDVVSMTELPFGRCHLVFMVMKVVDVWTG